jgi:hypothetical protein
MPLLFEVVRPIGEVGEDLDEHMVPAQAEGRRLRGDSRGRGCRQAAIVLRQAKITNSRHLLARKQRFAAP